MKSRKLACCEENAVAQMRIWCHHKHQYFIGFLLKKKADFEAHCLRSLGAGKLREDGGKGCLAASWNMDGWSRSRYIQQDTDCSGKSPCSGWGCAGTWDRKSPCLSLRSGSPQDVLNMGFAYVQRVLVACTQAWFGQLNYCYLCSAVSGVVCKNAGLVSSMNPNRVGKLKITAHIIFCLSQEAPLRPVWQIWSPWLNVAISKIVLTHWFGDREQWF